ncbi:MAG: Gfo/Idh/MocA family oxidoreductase [Candidatus Bathyarchaeia archaeon]
MDDVGIGIVGLGFVGEKAHLSAFASIQGARVAAVADVDPGRVRRACERFNIPSAYLNHKDLVKDRKVDAVVVAVPTYLHLQVALDAIKAGKHVLCEMPLAPTIEEARLIVEEARKASVILMPSLNFRFTPNYVKAHQLIEDGSIGEPVAAYYREFIAAEVLAQQWPAGSWAWDPVKTGGGPSFTLSVWSIDLLRWLLKAEVTETYTCSNNVALNKYGTEGYNLMAILKYSNDAVANLQFSGSVRPAIGESRLELLGSNMSSLVAVENKTLTLYSDDPDRKEWIFRLKGPKVWGHYQEDEHFINVISRNIEPAVSGEDALKAQETAIRIHKRL